MPDDDSTAKAISAITDYLRMQSILDQIPVFDGKESNLRSFIYDVEQGFAILGKDASERDYLIKIMPKIRGSAREVVEGRTFATIKELVTRLKEAFTTTSLSFAHYHTQLSQLKMSGPESVTEYGNRAKHLVALCRTALTNEFGAEKLETYLPLVNSAALNGFLRGLKQELELRVIIRGPTTLELAIEIAKAEEQSAAERSRLRGFSSPHPLPFSRPFQPSYPAPRGYPRPTDIRPPFQSAPQSNGRGGENFNRPRDILPAHLVNPQETEYNHYPTPRNQPFTRPAYQPPVPRYAERETAIHAMYSSPDTYPEYQTQQEPYPSYSGHQSFHEGNHYYDPHGFPDYQQNHGVWYTSPTPQYYSYHDQPGPKAGDATLQNSATFQSLPSSVERAQPSTTSEGRSSDLNLTSARLATQQASASPGKIPTAPTYTIMKVSALQKNLMSSNPTRK